MKTPGVAIHVWNKIYSHWETEEIFLILSLTGKPVHITQGNFIAPLVEDEELKML